MCHQEGRGVLAPRGDPAQGHECWRRGKCGRGGEPVTETHLVDLVTALRSRSALARHNHRSSRTSPGSPLGSVSAPAHFVEEGAEGRGALILSCSGAEHTDL